MAAFPPVLRWRRNNGTGTSPLGSKPQRGDNKQAGRRSSRLVGLVILTLIGMWLLDGMTAHAMSMQTHAIAGQAFAVASPSSRLDGLQRRPARGAQTPSQKTLAQTPTVAPFCLPTDLPCLLTTAMRWVTQQLVSVFLPLIDAIHRSPLNFITQTPICVYACPTQQSPYPQNTTIGTFVSWAVGVVDAAVAVFIVLAGYNLMMARQIGASYADIAEFLPCLALSVMAANLCLFFLQCFIDLENALCQEVVRLFAIKVLSDTVVGIFHGNLQSLGLLTIALAIILGVMSLLLVWQMLVRLALLFLLIVLAPFGLLCFGLPQTQGYGRLWTSTFAATLFVQFFQVVTLALGGMLISYTQTTGLLNLDTGIVSLLVSTAVMSLVLRLPGMLHNWALRPVAEAGLAPGQVVGRLISAFV